MKLSKKAKIWIGSAVGFVVLGCFGAFNDTTATQTVQALPSLSPSSGTSVQPEVKKIVKTKQPTPSKTKKKKIVEWTPESVYYDNCSEVRAAGKAPIYKGDPGYAKHLDRDKDGIGCDK